MSDAGVPLSFLRPDWPVPARVRSAVTLRAGGVSPRPYDALNLGVHVGDDLANVMQNRALLRSALALPSEPVWLKQVHGTQVAQLPALPDTLEADASCAASSGVVCAILTADCLPVLFCDDSGSVVAAAHAGWRGLLAGVLENTVQAMNLPASRVQAWLGPAIGPQAFEVGSEVRDAFIAGDAAAAQAFVAGAPGKYFADLYLLARQRLQSHGLTRIYGGGLCTFSDAERFYSYRRESVTGRLASLIWLQD
ncbi:MAG: peptidoglycan editing factor PgeF [Pseudomonadota bacterium]